MICSIGQMNSVDLVETNKKQIYEILRESAEQKAKICFLPENCLYMRVKEGEIITPFRLSDDVFAELSEWAKKFKLVVHLGSLPLELEGKVYNSTVVISEKGEVKATYQKIHLFDIELEGAKAIRESDVFCHGGAPQIIDLFGWKIGQTICYDLRFAELFHYYGKNEVDLIVVPSAFLVPTGQVHWEVLLRARAIENQCFIVAAAQSGTHKSTKGEFERTTFGNSLVVDPWGRVLHKREAGVGCLTFTLDKAEIAKVRKQIPMKSHRRL